MDDFLAAAPWRGYVYSKFSIYSHMLDVPNVIIGILGGGQLGRMMLQACQNWPVSTYVLDSNRNPPSQGLCTKLFQGSLLDYHTVLNFGRKCKIVTF